MIRVNGDVMGRMTGFALGVAFKKIERIEQFSLITHVLIPLAQECC